MSGQAVTIGDVAKGVRQVHERLDRLDPQRGMPTLTGRQKFARHAVLQLLANYEKRDVRDIYLERYVSRGATGPATSTVPGWAVELHSTALLDFLNSGQAPAMLPRLRSGSVRPRCALP